MWFLMDNQKVNGFIGRGVRYNRKKLYHAYIMIKLEYYYKGPI